MNAIAAKTKAAAANITMNQQAALVLGKIIMAFLMITGLIACAFGVMSTNIVLASSGALMTIAGAILFAWMVVNYEICD